MEQSDDHLIQQYPAWREALKSFFQEGIKPGDTITFDWLYAAFMIERPGRETTLAAAQKAQLQFLSQFKAFEEALLTEHQTALASVHGVGYRVVPPAEQTSWAEQQGAVELKRALRKYGERLTNVNLSELSGDQRKQNADALARFGNLAGMMKRGLGRRSVFALDTDDDASA